MALFAQATLLRAKRQRRGPAPDRLRGPDRPADLVVLTALEPASGDWGALLDALAPHVTEDGLVILPALRDGYAGELYARWSALFGHRLRPLSVEAVLPFTLAKGWRVEGYRRVGMFGAVIRLRRDAARYQTSVEDDS